MIKNNFIYMEESKYFELLEAEEEKVGCTNRIKNIYITKKYSIVEFAQYLFLELGINWDIPQYFGNNLDALYDVLRDIPESLNNKIVMVNLFIENQNYLTEGMLLVLKDLTEYLEEEIITTGYPDSFPMSFDVYIKENIE